MTHYLCKVIIYCVSKLAYELNLSFTMWIHLIVSITHLKLSLNSDNDSYSCNVTNNSSLITNKNDDYNMSFYKIEKLLNKQTIK